MKRFLAFFLIATSIGAITVGLGLQTISLIIPNSATIGTIGVEAYWDQECTTPVTNLQWGILYLGDVKTSTFFLKNSGTQDEVLSMFVDAWQPVAAETYISLTWNRQETILPALTVINATFTLQVSPSIQDITNFSFNINIIGTA